jgi:hypothetical protein
MTDKALAIAIFGARGTGKGAGTRQLIDRTLRPPRLMVFDFKNDPGPSMAGVGVPITSLADLARAAQAPRFRLRYLVNHAGKLSPVEQFEGFCEIAWEAGNLLMWVDELAEVTKATKAPPVWRRCVNVGRDYEVRGVRKWLAIVGTAQRFNEVDKSFIGNCDIVRTGRLGNPPDAKAIATAWGCDQRELLTLPDLHYIEKRAGQAELRRGVLSFGTRAPVEVKKRLPAGRKA